MSAKIGDVVAICRKNDKNLPGPAYFKMKGIVVKVYSDGAYYVKSLESNFPESLLKKWARYGKKSYGGVYIKGTPDSNYVINILVHAKSEVHNLTSTIVDESIKGYDIECTSKTSKRRVEVFTINDDYHVSDTYKDFSYTYVLVDESYGEFEYGTSEASRNTAYRKVLIHKLESENANESK